MSGWFNRNGAALLSGTGAAVCMVASVYVEQGSAGAALSLAGLGAFAALTGASITAAVLEQEHSSNRAAARKERHRDRLAESIRTFADTCCRAFYRASELRQHKATADHIFDKVSEWGPEAAASAQAHIKDANRRREIVAAQRAAIVADLRVAIVSASAVIDDEPCREAFKAWQTATMQLLPPPDSDSPVPGDGEWAKLLKAYEKAELQAIQAVRAVVGTTHGMNTVSKDSDSGA